MTENVILTTLDFQAIAQILENWQIEFPQMGVLALLPEVELHAVNILQAACNEKNIPLCGAIFPALVTENGFITKGAWLLRLDKMPPMLMLTELNADDIDVGDLISAAVEEHLVQILNQQHKPTFFMMFFDAMLPNIASILDALYIRLSDRVRYAGVNAGSETFQPMPCLFDNDQIIGNGLLGLLLPDALSFVLQHAYAAPEHAMVATSSESNCINTIDWRSAFDVYQELIGTEYGIALTRENFYTYGAHFPFGILRANGEVVVRIPVAITEAGAIHCVGEVPENAMLALLRAPSVNDTQCIERLVDALSETGSLANASPLLTFYCAGRRMHLGETAASELLALKLQSGASILVGALSLGEIGAQESGYPTFHNAALVCKIWERI